MARHDREFFSRELESFVPQQVADAHCHWWTGTSGTADALGGVELPQESGREPYLRLIDDILPGREVFALAIPTPWAPDKDNESRWLAREAAAGAGFASAVMVAPEDDPERVRDMVRSSGAAALKCYHSYSDREPTWQAELPDYLPEALVRIAHEEELAIILHLVRDRGPADPSNLHWIRTYCTRYPRMRLVLAHSARAFQPSHALEALSGLADLANLYFDCSANCEAMAHLAVIRHCGHERLMYGSDFPVSHHRGRSVGAADSFIWLYEQTPVWEADYVNISPVYIGLEHLRSLKWACWAAGLTDTQIEGIFVNNARRVLGIGGSSG
jgi:glutamate-1-semialdehyde 2,1-aminomutase